MAGLGRGTIGACLAASALMLAACGDDGGDDGQRGFALPQQHEERVTPPQEQLLAVATKRGVGVLRGDRVELLDTIPPDTTVVSLQWSGDGESLAWTFADDEYQSKLVVHELGTGRSHRWPGGAYMALAPSPHGVTLGSYEGAFVEYRADGATRRYAVEVPGSYQPVEQIEDDDLYRQTDVSLALPLRGRWLVAAENTSRMGAHGGPHRLYELDPISSRMVLVGRSGWGQSQVFRASDDAALWVSVGSGGACDSYAELAGYGMEIPQLPKVEDGSWDVRRALVSDAGVDVVGRQLAGGWVDGTVDCTPDTDPLHWLSFRDGRWEEVEDDVADLALAEDGRVARVRGRMTGLSTGVPEVEWLGADVTASDGERISLPHDTTGVLFSPAAPMSLPTVSGRGPALGDVARLGPDGAGPLRFGADPQTLQDGTSSALRFALDAHGCGTVRAQDADEQERAGIVGHLVGGRLDWLEVTSRDSPVDYGDTALSEQQPDVSAIASRGPETPAGVRVGDAVDQLLSAHGTPRETTAAAERTTRYRFESGSRVLIADVDEGGTVRRLEWRRAAERASCGTEAR